MRSQGMPLRVTSPRQPLPPYPNHFLPIPPKRFIVAGNAVIPKVSCEFPAQGFHLHPQRFVQVLPTPLANSFKTASQPLVRGAPSNHPPALPSLAPVVGKAQKVEGARRCALAPGVVRPSPRSPERHQPGFLLVQLQSVSSRIAGRAPHRPSPRLLGSRSPGQSHRQTAPAGFAPSCAV